MGDMFPGAGASVYYNEDGEVLGWDDSPSYEPEYCDQCGYCHAGRCTADDYDPDEFDQEFCHKCGESHSGLCPDPDEPPEGEYDEGWPQEVPC